MLTRAQFTAVFLTLATAAFGSAISIRFHNPWRDGTRVVEDFTLAVEIRSTYEVDRVVATVGGKHAPMEFSERAYCASGRCPGFIKAISMQEVPFGQFILSVTASDVLGNTTVSSLRLNHDQLPTVSVLEPTDEAVFSGKVRVRATCSDDGNSGCELFVRIVPHAVSERADCSALNSKQIRLGSRRVDTAIDLSAYDGRSLSLCFAARDATSFSASDMRVVHIEKMAPLTLAQSVPGKIADVDSTRILYLADKHPQHPVWRKLVIRDRLSGSETVIAVPLDLAVSPTLARLSTTGAIFVGELPDATSFLGVIFDWSGGPTTELGRLYYPDSLKIAGDYAIWNNGPYGRELNLRQFSTNTQSVVNEKAGTRGNTLLPDGAIYFWTNDRIEHTCNEKRDVNILSYHAGTTYATTDDTQYLHRYPVSDGSTLIYSKSRTCEETTALMLREGSNEIELDKPRHFRPFPGIDYQVVNGWAGYTKLGNNGQRQVWLRDPQGVSTQLTRLGTSSTLDLLAPTGELLYLGNNRRFLYSNGRSVDVGSRLGRTLFLDGRFYLILGDTLFEIDR